MRTPFFLLPATALLLVPILSAADSAPIWSPAVGDSWVYQVSVTVQEGTQLPNNIPGQEIEKLEGKTRASYTQTMVYRGLQPVGKDKGETKAPAGHAFTVSNGDKLEETQFMSITDTSIDALGVQPAGKDLKSLTKPIPVARSNWKGGESFAFMLDHIENGKKMRMVRKCRVLGWETLETKAGKFKALHVQVTGLNGLVELKRSYWFTPGTGFIKEVKKYYVGDRTILTQTRVLEGVSRQ